MIDQQKIPVAIADNHFRSAPDRGNPSLSPVYGTGTEILHVPEPRLEDNQKELDLNAGLEPSTSKGRIWGMERKTFMVVLVVFVILIIAVAAGVGWGVAGTKNKDSKIVNLVSESTQPKTGSSGDHATLVTVTSISSSPTPTPIRKNTPLAAFNWNTNNIQVFYKLQDGSIRSRGNDGLKWEGGSPQITNLKPRDDSGLAVVGWFSDNVEQIRVYTVSESNTLWESGWNSSAKSWASQDISTGLDPVAPGSYLTAYAWLDNGLWIRVYYQREDGTIREAAFNNDKGWGKGAEPTQGFPKAKNGTGLAIVPFPDTNEREAKLYYQNTGGKLISFDYKRNSTSDGSWQDQDPTVDHGWIPDGTNLAAVLGTGSEMILRIYLVREAKLVEIYWSKNTGWQTWNMRDAAGLGVTAYAHGEDIQVFYQDTTGYLSTALFDQSMKKWTFPGVI